MITLPSGQTALIADALARKIELDILKTMKAPTPESTAVPAFHVAAAGPAKHVQADMEDTLAESGISAGRPVNEELTRQPVRDLPTQIAHRYLALDNESDSGSAVSSTAGAPWQPPEETIADRPQPDAAQLIAAAEAARNAGRLQSPAKIQTPPGHEQQSHHPALHRDGNHARAPTIAASVAMFAAFTAMCIIWFVR